MRPAPQTATLPFNYASRSCEAGFPWMFADCESGAREAVVQKFDAHPSERALPPANPSPNALFFFRRAPALFEPPQGSSSFMSQEQAARLMGRTILSRPCRRQGIARLWGPLRSALHLDRAKASLGPASMFHRDPLFGRTRSKDFMKNKENAEPIELGTTTITEMVMVSLRREEVLSALWRHAREDWGLVFVPSETDSKCGREIRRLVSNHKGGNGTEFQIVTDTELLYTLIRLPGEPDEILAYHIDSWLCSPRCPTCGD
jgi:hypothetical protein